MDPRTAEPPFPDACRTGRKFISPCCTASIVEFDMHGTLNLASHVAGHGWSAAWQGRIKDINDTGTIIEQDGSEQPVHWRASRGDS